VPGRVSVPSILVLVGIGKGQAVLYDSALVAVAGGLLPFLCGCCSSEHSLVQKPEIETRRLASQRSDPPSSSFNFRFLGQGCALLVSCSSHTEKAAGRQLPMHCHIPLPGLYEGGGRGLDGWQVPAGMPSPQPPFHCPPYTNTPTHMTAILPQHIPHPSSLLPPPSPDTHTYTPPCRLLCCPGTVCVRALMLRVCFTSHPVTLSLRDDSQVRSTAFMDLSE